MRCEPFGLSILYMSVFGPRGCLHGSFTCFYRSGLLFIALAQICSAGTYDLCGYKSSRNAKAFEKPAVTAWFEPDCPRFPINWRFALRG